jgi:outer membrane protein OmpA-like peptidoglycan-associated protein
MHHIHRSPSHARAGRRLGLLLCALAVTVAPRLAGAQDVPASQRYKPEPFALELGGYWGVASYSKNLALEDADLLNRSAIDNHSHQRLQPGASIGARLAFFPTTWLGIEGEGGVMPTRTMRLRLGARLYSVRGHLVLQLPTARLVPFVVVGAGMMGINSDVLGEDTDLAVHVGGGLKYAVTEHLSVRLDGRGNLTDGRDGEVGRVAEVLIGLSATFGRTPYTPYVAPSDRDGDGVIDDDDQCPDAAGPAPDGCPPPPDADGDGIDDARDACPSEPEDGGKPSATDGCPDRDKDGDGIEEPADQCPAEAGIAPSGCPDKDSDADGVMDSTDKCVSEPETKNGFEDKDGCPDELPKEVAKFTGVIKGILFDSGKTTIKPTSTALLDEAAKVMTDYPELQMLITGHTDDSGPHDKNMTLSQGRADAVKAYLVGKGVAEARIETRGAGPDEPVADNKTPAGRAENRRIVFTYR